MEVDEAKTKTNLRKINSCKSGNAIKKPKLEFKPNLVQRKNIKEKSENNVIDNASKMADNTPLNEKQMANETDEGNNYSGAGNRFQIMADTMEQQNNRDDIWCEIRTKNIAKQKKTMETSTNMELPTPKKQSNKTNAQQNQNMQNERKEKIPPIIIFQQTVDDSIKLIEVGLKIKNFNIKRYHENKHAILTKNKEDYNNIKNALKQVAAPYFSYCPKSEKMHTMLLKGLDPISKPEEILKELNEMNVEHLKFISVKNFITKSQKQLPIFLVQLSPDSIVNNLRRIKYVNYQVVRWEKLNKKDITQCKRCQRFGHTASNFCMVYRCVKCVKEHSPGNCTITGKTEENKQKMTCALCKNIGHPASYRGCPKYIELKRNIQIRKEENKIKQISKSKMFNNFVQKNISFANIVGSSQQEQTQPIQSQSKQVESNCMEDIKAILMSIQNQLNSFKVMLEEEKSRIDILGNESMDE